MIGGDILYAEFKSTYGVCDAFSELRALIRDVIFADENLIYGVLLIINSLCQFSQMNILFLCWLPFSKYLYAKLRVCMFSRRFPFRSTNHTKYTSCAQRFFFFIFSCVRY